MSRRLTSKKRNGLGLDSSNRIQMTVDDTSSGGLGRNGDAYETASINGGSTGRLSRSGSLQSLILFRKPGKSYSLSKVFSKKSKNKLSPFAQDNVAYDVESQQGPPSTPSVSAMALGMERDPSGPAFWEIPRTKLVVGNLKQAGKFSDVFFGKVFIGTQSLVVDIKKPKAPGDKKRLMTELAIMSRVNRHSNVLGLIGACTKSGPVYLAFESMEPVRLDVFLRTVQDVHKPVSIHAPDFNITTPLMPLLVKFAVDITTGLSHLASKRVVQHSLGVMNVALTSNLVAKVTNFSWRDEITTSHGANSNQNRADSLPPLPIKARWMAYETLLFSTYTEKSNVWSLGVMIWEIMSFGHEPFEGFQGEELSQKLSEGYTLNQPDGCPDDIYEIIQSCVRLESSERPTLKSLVARLARRYECIKMQDKDTRAEVFQSLAQLSDNHDNMSPPQIRSMEMLTNSNINTKLPQARLMAVQYAATAFPGSHVASKFSLLSACGDENAVVRTEATNILKMQARIAEMDLEMDEPRGKMLPPFPQMMNYIRQRAFDSLPKSSEKSQGPLGVFTIPFNALVYEKVATYMRMCLAYSAGVSPNVFKTSLMMKQGPALSRYVDEILRTCSGDKYAPIPIYVGLLRQYISAIGGGRAVYWLLELMCVSGDKVATQFVKKIDNLKMLLHSDDEAVRLYTAQIMGVVLFHARSSLVVDVVRTFASRLDSMSEESSQATLWALGYIIGRQMQKEKRAKRETFARMTDEPSLEEENVYRRAIEVIVSNLDSSSPTLVKAACTALAEIGRNGPLPIPKGGKNNGKATSKSVESVRSKNGEHGPTKLSLVQRLGEILNAKTVLFLLEIKKEAAQALAYLTVGEPEFPYRKLVIDALREGVKITAPSRDEHIPFHFHLADSLASTLQGPGAPAALNPWLEESTTPLGHSKPVNGDLKTIVEALLADSRETHNSDQQEAIATMLIVLLETFRHSPQIEAYVGDMSNIVKRTVSQWDAQGVINSLPSELQKRVLQVLKMTRVSRDASEVQSDSRPVSNDSSDLSIDIPEVSSSEPTVTDEPLSSDPSPDAPSNDAPSSDSPLNGAPSVDAPSNDAPSVDAPSNDAPSVDAPSSDTPPELDAQDVLGAFDEIANEEDELTSL